MNFRKIYSKQLLRNALNKITLSDRDLMIGNSQIVPHALRTIIYFNVY